MAAAFCEMKGDTGDDGGDVRCRVKSLAKGRKDDGVASPFGCKMKCCTRRRDLFHGDYKQGEGC